MILPGAAKPARCAASGIVLHDGGGVEGSSHLGKYRWVVERSIAWLHRFRRLLVRYERRADIHLAFLLLAAALIAFLFC